MNLSSDTHASILKDGEISSCIGEERYSRIKNHIGFPQQSIKAALAQSSLHGSDIDYVAVGFEGYLKLTDMNDISVLFGLKDQIDFSNEKPLAYRLIKLRNSLGEDFKRLFRFSKSNFTLDSVLRRELARLGIECPVIAVDHHTAHAMSSYYFSNKNEALVITGDGYGDGKSGAIYKAKNGVLDEVSFSEDKNSLGLIYSAITKFCGFKSHRHEGKITGLAAYGDGEAVFKELKNFIKLNENNLNFEIDFHVLNVPRSAIYRRLLFYKDLITGSYLPGFTTRNLLKIFKKKFSTTSKEDLSAGVQLLFETLYKEQIQLAIEKTGLKFVCLAGGNFANVRLNQKIIEETDATGIFIHPNMGDGGCAIGAAAAVYSLKNGPKKFKTRKLKNVYLGDGDGSEKVSILAQKYNLAIQKPADVNSEAAKLIAEGYVIGRVTGKMEYGPRALGNRSILAHPFDPSINQELNERLTRTEFMPFAPSVLADQASKFYKVDKSISYAAEFMTITVDVTQKGRNAAAACHIDQTARPHFVTRQNNATYYDLIEKFGKITGYPILINTSFNKHEEPIIRDIEDAVNRLIDGSVHFLLCREFLISCKDIEPAYLKNWRQYKI